MLITYIRNENRVPFGCVVAISKDQIGYSLCHPRDNFNKELARNIAYDRALMGKPLPDRNNTRYDLVAESVNYIKTRAERYYK